MIIAEREIEYNNVEVNFMQNTTINNAVKNFEYLVEQALADGETINVASDMGNVVIISEHFYNSLLLTAEVNSNPEFKASLLQGLNEKADGLIDENDVIW